MRMFQALTVAALSALPLLASSTYQIDPVHSEVSFRTRHLGLSIGAASINTENTMRDNDLRSPNFFSVGQFPSVTFRSVAGKPLAKDRFEITGDFSLHGTTKRITIPVTLTGTNSTPKETRAGFEGTLTLNRNDYGITYMPGIVGQDVSITLGIEAVKTETKP